jgi:cytochrome c peroxidase
MWNGRFNAPSGDPFDNSLGFLFPLPEGSTMFPPNDPTIRHLLQAQDAPLDRFARGNRAAMSVPEKRGALLFFGKAGCVSCHAVAGTANEMFSDFDNHVVAVPQIAPAFGVGLGNVVFDGPGEDEDFGLEQGTGNPADRYKFRTAPLRNIARAPAFFHNGAFTRLEDAIRHHLDPYESVRTYDPKRAGVPVDLQHRIGPMEPVLERLDPQLRAPIYLTLQEFEDLVRFVRDSLLDPRTSKAESCRLVPASLPSGLPLLNFHGCR